MKIAILGAGAMGTLFGSYLSRHNDVWLIDNNPQRVADINEKGVRMMEKEGEICFSPRAVSDTSTLGEMDLLIVFVKSMYSRQALRERRGLIGPQTRLLSLQNGAGHEKVLSEFAPMERVILGATQHNCSIMADGCLHHGGGGQTVLGVLTGEGEGLCALAANFTQCGFETEVSDDVRWQIWRKMLLNASASSLTAVLQCPLGYVLEDAHSCALMEAMVREAVRVANGQVKRPFDAEEEIARIKGVLANARNGYTSIYADIARGARTEVDTISGYVVSEGDRQGIAVPNQRCVVELIHAMEGRSAFEKK